MRSNFPVTLLYGVTGSGKTAVYLAAMQAVLEAGRSAILLVPEIGLTPAVAANLHQIFGEEVAILHSALSDAERAEQWHRIKRGRCAHGRGHAFGGVRARARSGADRSWTKSRTAPTSRKRCRATTPATWP